MAARSVENAEAEEDRGEEQEAGEAWEWSRSLADTHDCSDTDQEGCRLQEHQLDEPWILRAWP